MDSIKNAAKIMDFETFKKEALKTGIPFSSFTDKGFIDSYAATIPSHNEKHFTMYYPNNLGGVTITKGWGAERKIIFCDKIEDAKEYYGQR
jgi:hypothetical protein